MFFVTMQSKVMAISTRVLCYFSACFEEDHFCTLILYSVPNLNSPFRILDNSKLWFKLQFWEAIILISVNIRDCLDLGTCKFYVFDEETVTNLCWRDSSF